MKTAANDVEQLAVARRRVLDAIERGCRRVGRDPSSVTLVAVSKMVPAERLRAAVAAGLTLLGENRVQEAAAKARLLPAARWHLVGHLQSNKAARAVELFETIQSVDSLALARRLDAAAAAGRPEGPLPVYLQVNVDRDPAKSGFDPGVVEAELGALVPLGHLRLDGLMTVGRLAASPAEARSTFARLRALSERLRTREPALGPGLSMGMSDDFEVAIEEGSTVVRVGRALFGERPADG